MMEDTGSNRLERRWWKYALGLVVLQLLLWVLLGYKLNPALDLGVVLRQGYLVYLTFIAAAILPFLAGRFQMRILMWFGLAGFVLADLAYFLLGLFEPARRMNLLPYAAFFQLYVTCFGLGVVFELGRYVYRKVRS